uniref:Uncharacterized protein n=1 Tax=Arundo donax TaxID=35708 RepID=A0A0A9C5W9_ARUDO
MNCQYFLLFFTNKFREILLSKYQYIIILIWS